MWKKTCTEYRYELARKTVGGKHLLENAFWGIRHFDVQLQVCICMYVYVFICITHVLTRIELVCADTDM